jgi:hypothetical protein
VDLADGGVQVHHQRPVAGTHAGSPRPREELASHLVELADVAEGERAQPGPDRGGRHHPVPEHRLGCSCPEQFDVVDAVPTGDHGMDQGEQLAAWADCAGPVAQVHQLVGELLDPEPLGQRRGQ